eukprot:Amastigsp_a845057_11.p9 type:complete len:100 gc:universal Amastigsp_a845057_11:1914-1615(-)
MMAMRALPSSSWRSMADAARPSNAASESTSLDVWLYAIQERPQNSPATVSPNARLNASVASATKQRRRRRRGANTPMGPLRKTDAAKMHSSDNIAPRET